MGRSTWKAPTPSRSPAREDPVHFELDGKYFRLLDEEGNAVTPLRGLAKPDRPAVLTEIRADGRAVSFFGDLHPSFYGNVVKAMASAKQGYPIVSRMLARVQVTSQSQSASFSRFSHSGVVQMSLACAEALHGSPRRRAA